MLQTLCERWINRETTTLKEQPALEPIQQVDPTAYDTAALDYFAHYGLDNDDLPVTHRFGTFESAGYTLAAHLYEPAGYTATVILLHGYLNHCGQFRHLIRRLLENNLAVALYDLPGHGYSSGETADIDSFDRYVRTTGDFMSVVKMFLHGPYHALGFSTGGAILIDMLLDNVADFDKIILAAPLIHWSAYEQSKGTYKVYKEFTDKIARFHRKNSSDKEFLVFNKTRDYLHAKHLSLQWVKALFDWNQKIDTAAGTEKQLLVIQGDKDTTVDWQYNLDLIQKKCPNVRIEKIPGANHELFNEAPAYKEKALQYVINYIK